MSQDIADMPGIDAAMERFNVLDAGGQRSETGGHPSGSAAADAASSTTTASAAADSQDHRDTTPAFAEPAANDSNAHTSAAASATAETSVASPSTDTRSAAVSGSETGKLKVEDGREKSDPSSTRNPSVSSGKTRYAKAQERLEKTWDAVNKRKGELDARSAALEQQRAALERDRAQFDILRRQAEQAEHTPEEYVQAAELKRRDADALRMRSRRAAETGRAGEAERLARQADKAEGLADDLAEYAERIKKNPPPGFAQRAQQAEQARKHWTIEAAKAFPDLARNGSRLQQVVAQHLGALTKEDPQLLAHPSLIYHVSRLADLQLRANDLQTAAARVPALEKDAEALRARIKELEASTSPAADGGVSKLGARPAEDYASLRTEAQTVGAIFG